MQRVREEHEDCGAGQDEPAELGELDLTTVLFYEHRRQYVVRKRCELKFFQCDINACHSTHGVCAVTHTSDDRYGFNKPKNVVLETISVPSLIRSDERLLVRYL